MWMTYLDESSRVVRPSGSTAWVRHSDVSSVCYTVDLAYFTYILCRGKEHGTDDMISKVLTQPG